RTDEADIVLSDDHISRKHARLLNHQQHVWLQDLGSANGSYVNGKRLTGAQLLFHGDRITFDTHSMQLIGKGADLTPVRAQAAEGSKPAVIEAPATQLRVDTTRVTAIDEQMLESFEVPVSDATGAFLLGASEPIAGQAFRLPMGRCLIGRDAACAVVIRDATVSSKHAELMLRAEGCTITNLLSTNGVRVNGAQAQTAQLVHGDIVRLGNVSLVFNDVPKPLTGKSTLKRIQIALIVASIALAVTIAWMLT
ncbi:MAG: FHA domain-containing protein, partial [Proteobacteria bacterium]|nr:FHA domain-containing protein [Pseudomonadota bacterium]